MSVAIPPFAIQRDGLDSWIVVDARMNIVARAVDEVHAVLWTGRLYQQFKDARSGKTAAEERREERREETVDEALAALYRENRDLAERVERAVRAERMRTRIEFDKLVRVAHRCYECAKFRTDRCWLKDGEPDAFRIACEFFGTVPHRLSAEEASLCELQAVEIKQLRRELFQLKNQ